MSELEQYEIIIRHQNLSDAYAQALIDMACGEREHATVFWSAIEVDEHYGEPNFDGPELVLRLAALTDEQRLKAAKTIVYPLMHNAFKNNFGHLLIPLTVVHE